MTTVRDLGDRRYRTLGMRDLPGLPRVVAAGPPVTTPGGHCHYLGGEVEDADAARAVVAEHARRGVDVIKVMASGGFLTPGTDMLGAQYPGDDVRVISDEAHRLGLKVTIDVVPNHFSDQHPWFQAALAAPPGSPERARFLFRPGQYMNVLLDDGVHRSFSMASAPAGNQVDFHVRRIPGGRFTDRGLRGLAAGDRLAVEIPLGRFGYHAEDFRPVVMAATGTGLAPIKSMLESLMDDPDCPPVSLYWGVRAEADLYLADAIRAWGERLYEFRFVPVLSRPGAAWRGRTGHVQDAIAHDFPDLSEHAIYLCGSPAMVADAKRRAVALHASPAHVYVDGFTFQHGEAA